MIRRVVEPIEVRWTDDGSAGRVVLHRSPLQPLAEIEIDRLLEQLGAERVSA